MHMCNYILQCTVYTHIFFHLTLQQVKTRMVEMAMMNLILVMVEMRHFLVKVLVSKVMTVFQVIQILESNMLVMTVLRSW